MYFSDGFHKGVGEAYILLCGLELLRDLDFDVLFKLSGRYRLTDRFVVGRFPRDRFGFLQVGTVVSMRLYSVPGAFRELYRRQLVVSVGATLLGVSLEDVLARGLIFEQVEYVSPLGVSGIVAVDRTVWIDE